MRSVVLNHVEMRLSAGLFLCLLQFKAVEPSAESRVCTDRLSIGVLLWHSIAKLNLTPECQVMLPLAVSESTPTEAWDFLGFTSANSLVKLVRLSSTHADFKDSPLQEHLDSPLLPPAPFEDANETLKWLISLTSVYCSMTASFTAKEAYTCIAPL